ncbi:MAG: cation-translocating P-type ATPase [Longimicrobiales bacterium]
MTETAEVAGEDPPATDAPRYPGTKDPWHRLSPGQTLHALGVTAEGLSDEEAAERLILHGANEIRGGRGEPWWSLALRQFRDPLIYILLTAAAVSVIVQHPMDAGVILAVVTLNAVIGYVQEARARDAMRALARLSAPVAEVLRGGRMRRVPARELVPGDIVLLSSGARVPADVRLLTAVDLEMDESALTGESLPVRKEPDRILPGSPVPGDQVNMAFAGTSATRGRARGVVVRTGFETEVGRIAEAVHELGLTRTPLQEAVHRFGTRVGLALLGLAAVVVTVGILRGMPPVEIFLTAVAVAVAAVPEGLPVVLTVALAVGVGRMASRKAIIRKLPAVETLGSTTVIASDKTGTLTRNQMTVKEVWAGGRTYRATGGGYDPDGGFLLDDTQVRMQEHGPLLETLRAGVLANEADAQMTDADGEPLGDPTEVALLVAAAKAGMEPATLRADHPLIDLLPFEPDRRYMATLHRDDAGRRVYVKGAPEAVVDRCDRMVEEKPGALDRDAVLDAAHEMAARGLRVLAMAYRPTEAKRIGDDALDHGFVFCGLQGMEDPVRPEAVESVRVVQRAGMRVLMLTGDHLVTAQAIGRQLGLGGGEARAVEGRELQKLADEDLDRLLDEGVAIFARVAPEHKLRIVQRLRDRGEIVAVTGDGVNDAPALRAAHLGVAMGIAGTDVAREASDMVLSDDNFATIRAAVEEGRTVFSNVRKVTFFLLSTSVGEVLTILVALVAGWPLPLLAAQILWVNLVTNGIQDVALAMEPGEPDLLDRKPRKAGEGLLESRLLHRLGAIGGLVAAGTLGVFWWGLESSGDLDTARTLAMTQLVVFQFYHVFNCRSLDRSIVRIPLFSNRFLFAGIVGAALVQLAVLYWEPLQALFRTTSPTREQWGVVLTVGASVIVGGEIDKWWNRRRRKPLG